MHRECGEFCERRDVDEPIAAHVDGEIVAAVLTLFAHLRGNPPDRRVVEQQRLNHRLQQIDQVIVTTNVCKLVGEDGFKLLRRQARERRRGQEHDWLRPADQRRHHHGTGLQHGDAAPQSQPPGNPGHSLLDAKRDRSNRTACEATRYDPPSDQPQGKNGNTNHPGNDYEEQ
jgi:hypothetical protein